MTSRGPHRDSELRVDSVAYADVLKEGPARDWYQPGALKGESYFVDGVLRGRARDFNPDGALAVEPRREYGHFYPGALP